MAEYVTYTDTNGIKWTIITTERNMMATVADDAEPRYIPPATDQATAITTTGDSTRPEVERVAFAKLRDSIEEYAKANRQSTGLSVKARAGVPWWAWLLGGLVLWESGKKRRRRG